MAHSYTPGLKVLKEVKIKKNRRLPLKGEILKSVGDKVKADDIVAKNRTSRKRQYGQSCKPLNIAPSDIKDVLLFGEGDYIKEKERIAETAGIFGYFKNELLSPVSGTIESISDTTGQIVIRERPIPVEVDAYIDGVVSDLIEDEGKR